MPDSLHPNAIPDYREVIHQEIKSRGLWQGETLYYEIVGFTEGGGSIQGAHNLDPKKDKEWIKQFGGEQLSFHYGCHRDPDAGRISQFGWQFDVYVYRGTLRSPDGNTLEYTDQQMRNRCKALGLNPVPVVLEIPSYDPAQINLTLLCKKLSELPQYNATEPACSEGIVLRVEGKNNLCLKYKSTIFAYLENIRNNDDLLVDVEDVS